MPETTNSWLSILSPAITFILGFVTAVFAEPFRRWWFRSKIELTFGNDSDHVAWTPYGGEVKKEEAYYIRVGVLNRSSRLARKCRAYLVNVEKKENAEFVETLYADSIQLAWSCRILGTELDAIDIPHGVEQYIDVAATFNNYNTFNYNTFKPQIKPFPSRYEKLFSGENPVLRFTIQVSGDELDPKLIKIVFCWKGKWDKFDVYKEE